MQRIAFSLSRRAFAAPMPAAAARTLSMVAGRQPLLRVALRAPARSWALPRSVAQVSAAPRSAIVCRGMSSGTNSNEDTPELTHDMALSVAHATYMQLDRGLQGNALDEIFALKGDKGLAERWQSAFYVFMTTTLSNIVPLGYTADQEGLAAFNQKASMMLQEKTAESKELMTLNQKVYEVLLRRAFGITEWEAIDIDFAREIQSMLAAKMQSRKFLGKVDEAMADPAQTSNEAKHRILLTLILEVQMEVMEDYGYEGEDGYIKLQAALMEHAADPQITRYTMEATMAVFERAGMGL